MSCSWIQNGGAWAAVACVLVAAGPAGPSPLPQSSPPLSSTPLSSTPLSSTPLSSPPEAPGPARPAASAPAERPAPSKANPVDVASDDGPLVAPALGITAPETQPRPPPQRSVARPRLDARFAAAQPLGEWRRHPLALTGHGPEDLVLFGPALGFEVEYTLQWFRGPVAGWGLGLLVHGFFFDTDDYTSHAAGNGPAVDASASLLGVHFVGSYRVLQRSWMNLDVSLGVGGLYPTGQETVKVEGRSLSFGYEFLKGAPSARLAVSSSFPLGDYADAVVEVNQLAGFAAVDHAGPAEASLYALGLSVGTRIWLGGHP